MNANINSGKTIIILYFFLIVLNEVFVYFQIKEYIHLFLLLLCVLSIIYFRDSSEPISSRDLAARKWTKVVVICVTLILIVMLMFILF